MNPEISEDEHGLSWRWRVTLPAVTMERGGIRFGAEDFPKAPGHLVTGPMTRRERIARRITIWREGLALHIAPWLDDDE